MEVTANAPQRTAEGGFGLVEWRVPRAEWFLALHVHELSPETAKRPLKELLEDWGGYLEETKLTDNVPAVFRTSLFEAIFEKSVFFREESGRRVVEVVLVIPKIVDWMGPAEKVEPQVRPQGEVFESMVKTLRLGDCR
jgi:hypothetical protein